METETDGDRRRRRQTHSGDERSGSSLKPVLNWTNICFANIVRGVRQTWKKFGELSSLLTRRNFYFANLVRTVRRTATNLCSGIKTLRSTFSGNCSSSSTNLVSDWLKPESSPMEEEKTGTATHGWWLFSLSLRRKWPHLWTCGRVSVICGTQQINK